MPTGGEIRSLKSLMTDITSLEVPDFQRNYSWEEQQIDAFIKDMQVSRDNGRSHFIGSTILMKKSNDPSDKTFYIIDGQQRFTTIFMTVAIIRDQVKSLSTQEILPNSPNGNPINVLSRTREFLFSNDETGQSRLISNNLVRRFFYEHIIRESTDVNPRQPMPQRQKYSLELRKGYARIQTLIKEELRDKENDLEKLRHLKNTLEAITNNFEILKIETMTFPESFDVFMTLNSRGMALGPSDLVKSVFMKSLTEGLSEASVEQENQAIASEWKDATDNIGDGDMDQFLRHFLVSRQKDSVQAKGIFNKIGEMINEGDLDPKINARKVLDDVIQKSSIYSSLLKPLSIDDPKVSEHCNVMRQILDSYRILMMVVLDDDFKLGQHQKRELARLCEVISVRWVLTGGNAQELEDHFQTVALALRKPDYDYAKVKILLLSKLPSDDKVSMQFNVENTRTSLIRVVLHKINILVGDTSNLISSDPSKMHVEHIAPQSPDAHWQKELYPDKSSDESTSEYLAKIENWGNKTILDKNINLSIKRKPFKEKCNGSTTSDWQGYKHSPIRITNELCYLEDWSVERINKRNKWLATCFLLIWSELSKEEEVVSFSEWSKNQVN